MADCLVDLILRPGHSDLPVVQAQLTVVASVETLAGGDQPGEFDGQVVPAEMVRQLARRLGLVPDELVPDGLVPDELVPDELVSVGTDRHGVPATEPRAATGTAAPEPATDDPGQGVDAGVDGCPPPGWSVLGWAELAAQAQGSHPGGRGGLG